MINVRENTKNNPFLRTLHAAAKEQVIIYFTKYGFKGISNKGGVTLTKGNETHHLIIKYGNTPRIQKKDLQKLGTNCHLCIITPEKELAILKLHNQL